jgi:hypothetical protein
VLLRLIEGLSNEVPRVDRPLLTIGCEDVRAGVTDLWLVGALDIMADD